MTARFQKRADPSEKLYVVGRVWIVFEPGRCRECSADPVVGVFTGPDLARDFAARRHYPGTRITEAVLNSPVDGGGGDGSE